MHQFPVDVFFPPSVDPDCRSLLPLFSFDASVLVTCPSKQSFLLCLNGVGGHRQNRSAIRFGRDVFCSSKCRRSAGELAEPTIQRGGTKAPTFSNLDSGN